VRMSAEGEGGPDGEGGGEGGATQKAAPSMPPPADEQPESDQPSRGKKTAPAVDAKGKANSGKNARTAPAKKSAPTPTPPAVANNKKPAKKPSKQLELGA
jgi:hypothetical protein